MSLEKKTPTEFKNASIGFTVLQTDVINMLDGDSLAIWAYLCSKPTDWVVRKEHIFNQLNIRRVRYVKAIEKLKSLGLIKLELIRNKSGELKGTTYIARNCLDLSKFTESNETVEVDESAGVDESATVAETRDSRKQHPYKDKDILQRKDLLQTSNNNKGVNENEQTNLEFNEPEKQNPNPNLGTHEEQIDLNSDKPKKPKRNTKLEKEKFAQGVKEQWHKSVVQHGIKQTSRGIGVTDTDVNNIQRIIKYTKDEGSVMDYTNPDTWLNYFNELSRICKRKAYLQKCVKSFSWAVKPTTYQKLGDDTYLNLEEVA